MEQYQIRQFSRIDGTNRNPGSGEHGKVPQWDNNIGYYIYTNLLANSKTEDGIVTKGDDASSASFIWKLDSSKNPDWRQEQYLVSAAKDSGSNNALFTMNDGTVLTLNLGALAWSGAAIPSVLVDSVFGRAGAVVATTGDYTASQITNAFDTSTNVLGDISEGGGSYHFTTTYSNYIDSLVSIGIENITNIGSGEIITDAERILLNGVTTDLEESIRDTTALFIQPSTTILWVHDDTANTLTGEVYFDNITTDDIPEGTTNLYFTEELVARTQSITLPNSGTVQGRIDASTAGTDYPITWVLTQGVSDKDLLITHNTDKILDGVSIFSIDGTGQKRLLVPFSTAYTGIVAPDDDSVLIEALTEAATEIRINITFV